MNLRSVTNLELSKG